MNRAHLVAPLLLAALVGLFLLLRPAPFRVDGTHAPRSRSFALVVEGGAMAPHSVEATEGDRLTLRLTSARPTEVHLHGYDLAVEVAPGEPGKLSFEADLTGSFEIEDHDSAKVLGSLIVRPR